MAIKIPKRASAMIDILKGDICTLKGAQALLNSANASLLAGSGVCGAIHKAAGRELERYCKPYAPLKVSQVLISPSFNLKNAEFIIHVLSPKISDANANDLLAKSYENVLSLCKERNIKSLGLCSLGTGKHGFSAQIANKIALETCINFIKDYDMDLCFVCFDERCFKAYKNHLAFIRKQSAF